MPSSQVAMSANCCCDPGPVYPCGHGIGCPSSVVVVISGMTGDNGYGVPCSNGNGTYTCVIYGIGAYSSDLPGGSAPDPEWVAVVGCHQGKWAIGLVHRDISLIEGMQWFTDNIDGCPASGVYAMDCSWCACTSGQAELL